MIDNFDDFCLWTYIVVDELWQRIAPWIRRPGPAPDCSDSALLMLALVGECRGWNMETELLSHWRTPGAGEADLVHAEQHTLIEHDATAATVSRRLDGVPRKSVWVALVL
ncbi:MAG: hypothetical protein M1118_12810 [Chloroflexi bacterium]|nr:hypothetical protein [Chloroflexota bacterium]